jgi:hypothetical protein
LVAAKFIAWKAIKDYEAEKKRKTVDYQGVKKDVKKVIHIDLSA